MAIKDAGAWATAEQTCFDHLTTSVEVSGGITAFMGEIPEGAYNCWMFEISGGAEPFDYEFNTFMPGGCGHWRMNAQVIGRFIERADAQFLGGILRKVLPIAQDGLDNIYWFRPRLEPTLAKVQIENRDGGFISLWELTYPLEVDIRQEAPINGQ